jgi:hypothetical protein
VPPNEFGMSEGDVEFDRGNRLNFNIAHPWQRRFTQTAIRIPSIVRAFIVVVQAAQIIFVYTQIICTAPFLTCLPVPASC